MEKASKNGIHRRSVKNLGHAIGLIAGPALILFAPDSAWAWGVGMHIAQGSFIMENLAMIKPAIAMVISANPMDYLYGSISADIFIGKGYKRREDHCHNWSVGLKVLEESHDDSTKAYAYGYLSHLAADIIAHNYLVPKMLSTQPASDRVGHVYWEFRADRFIKKRYWKMASKVISNHNKSNDTLIKSVMKGGDLRFGAKKMVFKRSIKVSDLIVWREQVDNALFGRRKLTKKQVINLNNYSINMIIDMLVNEEEAVCMRYDPVGTGSMLKAKQFRSQRNNHISANEIDQFFQVPDDITELSYVDADSTRF